MKKGLIVITKNFSNQSTDIQFFVTNYTLIINFFP